MLLFFFTGNPFIARYFYILFYLLQVLLNFTSYFLSQNTGFNRENNLSTCFFLQIFEISKLELLHAKISIQMRTHNGPFLPPHANFWGPKMTSLPEAFFHFFPKKPNFPSIFHYFSFLGQKCFLYVLSYISHLYTLKSWTRNNSMILYVWHCLNVMFLTTYYRSI